MTTKKCGIDEINKENLKSATANSCNREFTETAGQRKENEKIKRNEERKEERKEMIRRKKQTSKKRKTLNLQQRILAIESSQKQQDVEVAPIFWGHCEDSQLLLLLVHRNA